jgi:hypothetical protein
MRRVGTSGRAWIGALVGCAAFAACTYDFDELVAKTGSGGMAATGGGAGLGGQGGSSGAAGSHDGGGAGGGAGTGGAAGNADASGTGDTTADASRDIPGVDIAVEASRGDGPLDAVRGGDTATDRRVDTNADVRAEAGFDCVAAGGTVYQGHCYYASPTPTSWDVANTSACTPPAHLAVITTAGEQNVVAAILPTQDRWVGLRKDPGPPNQESRFYWVTKEPVSAKFWDSYDTGTPEPNFTGDCVRMAPTSRWGDTACTETYAAVCEYE